MQIITGRTGVPHVYAADDAELYKLFLGDGDFCLVTGNQLDLYRESPTEIRIMDGSLIMQGRLSKIRPSDGYDTLTLENGDVGYKRCDLIVAEYNQTVEEREIEEGGTIKVYTDILESVELKVVKGTPVPEGGAYVEPEITTGNIDAGETHQMKLWAVYLNGINADGERDYRVTLDTTPIQTALDYAVSSMANIDSLVSNYEVKIREELDRIMGVAKIAPLTVVVAHNLTSSSGGVLTVPSSTYTYTVGDVFVLYLNGLRVPVDKYTVTGNANALTVTLDYGTAAMYDDIEIEVWRPSNE